MSTHPTYDEKRLGRLLARGRQIGRTLKDNLPRAQHETQPAEQYRVLSAPLVTLFVSPSNRQESEESFGILAGSRTAFRVEASADGTISARFAGRDQHGIDGVKKLADALLAARDILLEPGDDMSPEFERRNDSGLRKRAECELEEFLGAARADLNRILGSAEAPVTQRAS